MSELYNLLQSLGNVATEAGFVKGSQEDIQNSVNSQYVQVREAADAKAEQDQQLLQLKQANAEKVATMLRMSPEQQNNIISELAVERMQLHDEQKALYEDIRSRQQVSFTDDPLAWIVNRYTVDDTIEQHNTVVDRANTVNNELTALSEIAAKTEEASLYGIKASNAMVKKAEADALAFNALKEKYAASRDLAAFNISTENSILHASGVAADAQYKAHSVLVQQEELALRKKEHAARIKEMDANLENREYIDKVAHGLTPYFGGTKPPPFVVQAMIEGKWKNGEADKWLAMSVVTGQGIGNTPGEAAVAGDVLKVRYPNDEQAKVAKQLQGYVNQAIEKETMQVWKTLKPEERAARVDGIINTTLAKSVKTGSNFIESGSIYEAPTIKNLLAVSAPGEVEGNVLIAKGLQALAATDTKVNFSNVYDTATALLTAGTYGELNTGAFERAVKDIRNTYSMVNTYVREHKGVSKVFNLPAPVSYRERTGSSTLDPMPSSVNSMNETEIRRALLLKYIKASGRAMSPAELLPLIRQD